MALDVYHQLLVRLYEETGGKDNRTANLKELAGKLGLQGNYPSIHKFLSDEGWIAESSKQDFVGITQWGVKEARTSLEGGESAEETRKKIVRKANQAASLARELGDLLENQAKNPTESFAETAKKFTELQTAFNELKASLG